VAVVVERVGAPLSLSDATLWIPALVLVGVLAGGAAEARRREARAVAPDTGSR
jgi:hypothetical protein